MKTLKDFLKKHDARKEFYEFAKDLTLEQFLETCKRGDWILWLFWKSNPDSTRELTLAKACCAEIALPLMDDKRSRDAVQVAIDFGRGRVRAKSLKHYAKKAKDVCNTYSPDNKYDAHFGTPAYVANAAFFAVSDDMTDNNICFELAKATYANVITNPLTTISDAEIAKAKIELKINRICKRYLPIGIWNIK